MNMEQNNNKVLFLCSYIDKHLRLYKDLENNDRCHVTYVGLKPVGKFLSIIRRIHMSKKINQVINLPFKNVWITSIPDNLHFSHLFCSSTVLPYVDIAKLNLMHKHMTCDLFLLDSLRAGSPIIHYIKPFLNSSIWNNIYTFDPEDARQYNFKLLTFCYYSKIPERELKTIDSDVYFCGGLKGGRDELIYSVFHYLKSHGLHTHFDLTKYPSSQIIEQEAGLYFNKGWKPYTDILSKIIGTKVIIEIMQDSQAGATLRYFEAVCYNKKLLTNNPHIIEYPFYNPKWMKIFKDLNDIDINWIKADESVDYKYNGEFSPTQILDLYK